MPGLKLGRILVLLVIAAGSAALAWWVERLDCAAGRGLPVHACGWGGGLAAPPTILDALWLHPLDGTLYRAAARAAARAGDDDRAERLYRIAYRRAPRDLETVSSLLRQRLGEGRWEEAAALLEHWLRIAPGSAAQAIPLVLRNPAGTRAVQDAMARRLAADPPWRDAMAGALAASEPSWTVGLLERMQAYGATPTPAETALWIGALDRLDRPDAARNLWVASLPADVRMLRGNVFDGGFAGGRTPPPYGWILEEAPGVQITRERPRDDAGGQALQLAFHGRPADFSGVRQDLVLTAGEYRLRVRVRSMLTGNRALLWLLACHPEGSELAAIQVPRRTTGWETLQARVQVPDGCSRQRLQLQAISKGPSQRALSGVVQLDDVRLVGPGATGR